MTITLRLNILINLITLFAMLNVMIRFNYHLKRKISKPYYLN
ncbi:hypothetical protein Belba_3255 [Belliella baltica DSM 15883]|uniref:Uncharacterized protein n=1 Tax=Belliella baltica (strain DSM 15883 / CIP 108006 / LMG 21964 / BA134) TaxID=866536 RepID=I3Z947_BELBD|nr:hypothetical protein Belba_3255 [Belliella baltica DSM 15883]